MELKVLLFGVFALQVIIIFLKLSCVLSVTEFSMFTRNELFKGQTCTTSQISFHPEGVQSAIQCALFCNTTPSCVGIFHQEQTGICVVCASFGEGDLQSLEGTQFYAAENNADNVTCGDPPSLSNGSISLDAEGETFYQDTATVICDAGFEATINKTTCTASGNWTGVTCNQLPCFVAAPENYRGNVNYTESGAECLRWDAVDNLYAIDMNYYFDYYYNTDESLEEASNFCRYPYPHKNDDDRPWCIVMDGVEESCNITMCVNRSQTVK